MYSSLVSVLRFRDRHIDMHYLTALRLRRYFTILDVVFPFAIGFSLWQAILGKGLKLAHIRAVQDASSGAGVLAKTLIWGSPLLAFGGCAVFLAIIWYTTKSLGFSLQRRVRHLKIGTIIFIAGLLISLFGILAGLPDKPVFGILYQPIISAIES